jgi:hypothetical protein
MGAVLVLWEGRVVMWEGNEGPGKGCSTLWPYITERDVGVSAKLVWASGGVHGEALIGCWGRWRG